MDEPATVVTEPPTEQGMLADKQKFWKAWNKLVIVVAVLIVCLLIGLRLLLV